MASNLELNLLQKSEDAVSNIMKILEYKGTMIDNSDREDIIKNLETITFSIMTLKSLD